MGIFLLAVLCLSELEAVLGGDGRRGEKRGGGVERTGQLTIPHSLQSQSVRFSSAAES